MLAPRIFRAGGKSTEFYRVVSYLLRKKKNLLEPLVRRVVEKFQWKQYLVYVSTQRLDWHDGQNLIVLIDGIADRSCVREYFKRHGEL